MAIRALPIVRPCSEAFRLMKGDEKMRFCESCGKHVHDLSSRTEDEARAFLTEARGQRLCIRYSKDTRGTIVFRAVTMAAAVSLAACSVTAEPAPSATTPAAHEPAAANAGGEGDIVVVDMGDAVIDVDDRCPDEPGPNDDGCPETAATPH
jgi:hypothetical protein